VSDGEKQPSDPWEYGVFIACIMRPALFPSQAGLLSPISTIALVNALEEHTTKRLGISWVSDVYCESTKIGGVSVEGKLNGYGSYDHIIVSFSVALNEQNFPLRLKDLIKKVFERETLSVPMLIAKNIINEFFSAYHNLKTPEKLMKQYSNKFILRKNYVKVKREGKLRKCKVLGVRTDNLALIVEERGNVTEIVSPNSVIIPKRIKIIE
jgi:BirA family biotin operon repressor/biotin-[acetyl-CoA-carboxylase] ligase